MNGRMTKRLRRLAVRFEVYRAAHGSSAERRGIRVGYALRVKDGAIVGPTLRALHRLWKRNWTDGRLTAGMVAALDEALGVPPGGGEGRPQASTAAPRVAGPAPAILADGVAP